MIPSHITHPPARQRPHRTGATEHELVWAARRYGQFENAHDPPSDYVPVSQTGGPLSMVRQLSTRKLNASDGTYAFGQPPGYSPLQSVQSVVAPLQWNALPSYNGDDVGRYHQTHQTQFQGTQHLEYHSAVQYRGYLHVGFQHNGAPAEPQHRGGQLQLERHGQVHFRGQARFRGPHHFRPESGPPAADSKIVPPDPEKTPTPQVRRQKSEQPAKRNHIQPRHAWKDVSECPQPSGKYVSPPLPPINSDLVVAVLYTPFSSFFPLLTQLQVGDIVRIKPWHHQYTWIEGRVEKTDFSVTMVISSRFHLKKPNLRRQNFKSAPRYLVSYRDPISKNLIQRIFCPHLREIMVKEPDEPGMRPLPEGIDRNIYACVPGPIPNSGAPVEMIWAHARVLAPSDDNDQINIRVLVGPSKNLMFDNFPMKKR
ncbi:hypothetical protein DFH09DRAFT_1403860 [Mycena vulgaris]|nr:hypothetical protein DFH09DRAFT_1403860 [Mycena vulgaris]